MFNRIFSYFSDGFVDTNKNILIALYRFILKVIEGLIIPIMMFLVWMVMKLIGEDITIRNFEELKNLLYLLEREHYIYIGLLILICLIISAGFLLIYHTFMTGIRASIKDYKTTGEKITFSEIMRNTRKFFTRSLNLNILIGIYFVLLTVIYLLILALAIYPFVTIHNFLKEYWYWAILIFFANFLILPVTWIVRAFFTYWRYSCEFYMIYHDCDWRDAYKHGRRFLFLHKSAIFSMILIFFVIYMIVLSVLSIFRTTSAIPYIGIIIGFIISIIQKAIRSYVAIMKNFTFNQTFDFFNNEN